MENIFLKLVMFIAVIVESYAVPFNVMEYSRCSNYFCYTVGSNILVECPSHIICCGQKIIDKRSDYSHKCCRGDGIESIYNEDTHLCDSGNAILKQYNPDMKQCDHHLVYNIKLQGCCEKHHSENVIYQLKTQLCNRGQILLKSDHPTLKQCGQRIFDPAFERCEDSKTCKTVVEKEPESKSIGEQKAKRKEEKKTKRKNRKNTNRKKGHKRRN